MLWTLKVLLVRERRRLLSRIFTFLVFCFVLIACRKISDEVYATYDITIPENDSLYRSLFKNIPTDSTPYVHLRRSILDFEDRIQTETDLVDSIDGLLILPDKKRQKLARINLERGYPQEISIQYHRVKQAFDAISLNHPPYDLVDTFEFGEMPLKLLKGFLVSELRDIKLKERALLQNKLQDQDSILN